MEQTRLSFFSGDYQSAVIEALEKMRKNNIALRIWEKDFRVWKEEPTEIANRLDWLNAPFDSWRDIGQTLEFISYFTNGRFSDIILAGMGGSSLCVEVFYRMFGGAPGFPRLQILDTTDPDVIRLATENIALEKTLFIISSKSGKTIEIKSLFSYLFNLVRQASGACAGDQFLFITDEGSPMLAQAQTLQIKHVFSNNPNIGGRFSALSLAGMIPAALIGAPIEKLLQNAVAEALQEKEGAVGGNSDACLLGAAMGTLALRGRDKLTLVLPAAWQPFGDWLEQLIAESTGKEGKGILPVLNEPPLAAHDYGNDRVFVFFADKDGRDDARIATLTAAGHPVFKIRAGDAYKLGAQMFLWEMATVVAGHVLGVNPFDQPDVEATKTHTTRMIAAYKENRVFSSISPLRTAGDGEIYGEIDGETVWAALDQFLRAAKPGAYVGLQLYVSPSPDAEEEISKLRMAITRRYRLAATVGYGPRYLHSTGQLHKGDAGNGLFIQIIRENKEDLPIPDAPDAPDSTLTFGKLKTAQADADRQALLDGGRLVFRLCWQKKTKP